MATINEKVKTALRIAHDYLDDDIDDTINACKLEMARVGISSSAITTEDELIQGIIKTYCLYVYASDEKLAEGYFKSFQYQLENARKSAAYNTESDTDSDTEEE